MLLGVQRVIDGAMFRAHVRKDLRSFIVQAVDWIATNRKEGERLGESVPESFDLHCGFNVSVSQQQRGHFTKYRQPGLCSSRVGNT